MKRVSYKVAKIIKEAGYSQKDYGHHYLCNGEPAYGAITEKDIYAPKYLEVWLWLWREKKIWIEILNFSGSFLAYINKKPFGELVYNDPEEAIVTAIEYLVDNDLIK